MTGLTDFNQAGRLAVAYQGPASGKRYEMWREGICRSFCRLDTEPFAERLHRLSCRLHLHAFAHSRHADRILGSVCPNPGASAGRV
jgi:hypothetical protein